MSGKVNLFKTKCNNFNNGSSRRFCPAKEITLGVCDKLFCRVGSGDELSKGKLNFYG